jgi:hypothetical protein
LYFPKPQNAGQQPQTNFLTKICEKTSIKKTCFSLCFQGKLLGSVLPKMEKQATSQQGNLSQKDRETKEGRRSLQHSHGRRRMTF